jgi:hypothetical protein
LGVGVRLVVSTRSSSRTSTSLNPRKGRGQRDVRAGAAGTDDGDAHRGDGGLSLGAQVRQLPRETFVGDGVRVEDAEAVADHRDGVEPVPSLACLKVDLRCPQG